MKTFYLSACGSLFLACGALAAASQMWAAEPVAKAVAVPVYTATIKVQETTKEGKPVNTLAQPKVTFTAEKGATLHVGDAVRALDLTIRSSVTAGAVIHLVHAQVTDAPLSLKPIVVASPTVAIESGKPGSASIQVGDTYRIDIAVAQVEEKP